MTESAGEVQGKKDCPGICRKKITVTQAGVMRSHTRFIWKGGNNYETVPCEGSGKPPRGIAAELVQKSAGRVAGSAMAAQQKAYTKLGLAWPPKVKVAA